MSNENNKNKFIDMLKAHLRQHGHDVYQSDSDADCLIVECALALSTSRETVVVSDDTSVLVLLIYHRKEGITCCQKHHNILREVFDLSGLGT